MRPAFIGTSWKMNKTLSQAMVFTNGLLQWTGDATRVQPFVVPPFTVLRDVARALSKTPVWVGAQNMHWEEAGAHTGEISAPMLRDCGAVLVEIGHSERRASCGETDETVGLKVATALRHGLRPLVCVGETAQEKENGQTEEVLRRQVQASLRHVVDHNGANDIVFAYEPVWAIGEDGEPANPDYANTWQEFIGTIGQSSTGCRPACLYGGSVDQDNCAELLAQPAVDGLFIGRAAWDVDGFLTILQSSAEVWADKTKETAS